MIAIRTQARITGEERFQLGPDLQVDPVRNCIIRDGTMSSVEPRVMELLVYLSSRPGELVTKRELMDQVWRTNVVDEAIQRAVSLLRSALGDSAHNPKVIETVPRRGYRMLLFPSPLGPAGIQARWAWLAAGAAAAALLAIAIVATPSPEPLAPVAQLPEQAAPPVAAENPGPSEASLDMTPPPRERAASSPSRSEQTAPGLEATPTPEALRAPAAPAEQPRAHGEAPSAPEAPPAPAPSPNAAR